MSVSVLHVIPTLDPLAGGTTAALAGMATAQAKAGLRVGVFSTIPEADAQTVAHRLEGAGVSIMLVGPTRGPLRRHPLLRARLTEAVESAHIVHVHGLWEEPQHLAFLMARKLGRPVVLSPHGMLDRWSLAQSRLKKQLYRWWRLNRHLRQADALHVTTPEEQASVSRFNLPAHPWVVPLGLDLNEFDPLPPQGRFRERFTVLGQSPFVLFLSRLHHKKGLELLLPAFAALPVALRHWRLVIAGPADSDAYLESLGQLAASLNIAERVVFAGMQHGPQRVEAMVDADVFALPSYQENFGIVVAEAGAARLPLLVSEQVNLAHFVSENQLGRVVQTAVPQITQALIDLLTTSDRKEIGWRARAAVFAAFDWDQIGPRWNNMYQSLLEDRSAPEQNSV